MQNYKLAHLSDAVLLRDLAALVAQDRVTTATLLAHIAEVDARRLYVPEGYPSMHAYCVGELRLSEDAAYKRIQAARAARQFPVLFTALAEGRLHLTAVRLLAPHLTQANADELIEAATHKGTSEIEVLLARRSLPLEPPQRITAVPARIDLQLAPGQVGRPFESADRTEESLVLPQVGGLRADTPSEHYLLHLTITKSTHDKLRHAQALMSHAVPTGDLAQLIGRALDALIEKLERRKLGTSCRPPRDHATVESPQPRVGRYVPTHVRRAVWERDEGQCTFVSRKGNRCKARRFLEFDHVDPVARGGHATVDRMRLRCRAHNQYEAERAFGAGFMKRKRREARLAAGEARARAAAVAKEESLGTAAAVKEQTKDVLAGLRTLGCRADEARRAAEFSTTVQGATLEERMRVALRFLGSPIRTSSRPPG